MSVFGCVWRRRVLRLLGGIVLPVCLSLTPAPEVGAEEPLPEAVTLAAPTAPVALDLAGYRHLALDKQPALAAYRASLAAAQAKAQGLDDLRVPTFIRRDLPIRRKQASLGVTAAQAQVDKAEWETVYAVTRNYLTVAYARQQQHIADQVLSTDKDEPLSLGFMRTVVQGLYKESTRRDLKPWDAKQIDVLLEVTRGRRIEAEIGARRGEAALREAIGLGPDCPVAVANQLPNLTPAVEKAVVLALAQSRRAEIVQACVAAELTGLEVEAQAVSRHNVVPTFASGGDIHAQPVPQGFSNGEYRPGATGLEMPPNLVGPQSARVEQAEALHARADAVVAKTRQLVALETEDAYLKWEQASRQLVKYDKAARDATDNARTISAGFAGVRVGPNVYVRPTLEDVLGARQRAIQLTLLVNQSRYQMLLALAALERVTAGGFCPGFDRPLATIKDDDKKGTTP